MIVDTNGDMFPQGTYRFRVSNVPEETDVNGYKGWQWSFEAETEDGLRTYNERFMVWLLAPLLRALGFTEIAPGKFDFDPTAALDREIVATIAHIVLDKGKSAGKTVARMSQIKLYDLTEDNPTGVAMKAQAPLKDDIPF